MRSIIVGKGHKFDHHDKYDSIENILGLIDDPKQLAIMKSKIDKHIMGKVTSSYEQKEQHLTYQIARDAYKYILDTVNFDDDGNVIKVNAKDALIHAAKIHEADIEAVLLEKSKKSGGLSKHLVRDHDKNVVQVDMCKRGVIDRQSLKNSKNVWQLLKLLSAFKYLYDKLKGLEARVNRIELEQTLTRLELELAKSDITRLQDHVNLPEMTPVEKAKVMKGMGFSQKDISDYLGKSISTVKRWWPTI